MGKLIIVSAPSGAGKSTLINHLLSIGYDFSFSISATSRPPRGNERNGVEYFFLSPDDFKQKIKNQEFIAYEEVYPNCFYGTLKSEVDKALDKGRTILFDVDVKGGINIKNIYKDNALSIFIEPPSINALRERLEKRNTDSKEMIEKRIAKATEELTYAPFFDTRVINDNLDTAKKTIETLVKNFLEND